MKWATKSLLFNALTTNLYFQAIKLKRFFRYKNSSLFFSLTAIQKNHFWSLFLLDLIYLFCDSCFLLPFTISIFFLFHCSIENYSSTNQLTIREIEEEVSFLFRTRKNPTEEKTSHLRLNSTKLFFSFEEIHFIYFWETCVKHVEKKFWRKFEIYFNSLSCPHSQFQLSINHKTLKKKIHSKTLHIQLDSPGVKHKLQLGIELNTSES